MGFRFRKSFKVMPGVRFNLSTRGASMSLGRRGATLNISSRGTRATVGVPGTGLSYTTSTRRRSTSAPGARRSTQRLAADYRRLALEAQYESAVDEVTKIESELTETLDAWRDLPTLRNAADLQGELVARPPENDNVRPAPLDTAAAEKSFREEVGVRVQQQSPRSFASQWLWLPIGLGSALLVSLYTSLWLLPVAVFFLSAAARAISDGIWVERLRPTREAVFAREWPQAHEQLVAGRDRLIAEHDASAAEATQRWLVLENERISELRRVLAGDAEAVEAAITSAVELLDFPFEAECAVRVEEEGTVVIDVDLPEIEDVIPETQFKVLKNGTLKEVKRKASDRNAAYASLVTGIAFHVAASALAAAPTVQSITVAGHTQRKSRSALEVTDTYVFEVRLARDAFDCLDGATLDPVALIQRLPSRIELGANGALKRITAPPWAEELWEAA